MVNRHTSTIIRKACAEFTIECFMLCFLHLHKESVNEIFGIVSIQRSLVLLYLLLSELQSGFCFSFGSKISYWISW